MARVGDLERIVEGLVDRGLVAPKFVGRQIGQALIDDLANLGTSLATSQATMRSQQSKRLSDFSKQLLKNSGGRGIGGSGNGASAGPAFDITKPFVVGKTKGATGGPETLAIATGGSKGFTIGTSTFDSALAKLASENTRGLIPEINTKYQGGNQSEVFQTLQDLQNALLGTATNPEDIFKLFNRS